MGTGDTVGGHDDSLRDIVGVDLFEHGDDIGFPVSRGLDEEQDLGQSSILPSQRYLLVMATSCTQAVSRDSISLIPMAAAWSVSETVVSTTTMATP